MLKKRLIFSLLFSSGKFYMSRNFDLQEVGDVDWLIKNFQFNSLIRSIDELIIVDVSRDKNQLDLFFKTIEKITRKAFMPLSLGGKIINEKIAEIFFKNGADKIIINSLYYHDPREVYKIIRRYGNQSITCSIDYKLVGDKNIVFVNNGSHNTGIELNKYVKNVKEIGFGDLLINSIDKDGLGYGYDLETLKNIFSITKSPIIASGGADNAEKLHSGIVKRYISAVNTSNIFNFVFDGLKDARDHILNEGVELPNWDFSQLINENKN